MVLSKSKALLLENKKTVLIGSVVLMILGSIGGYSYYQTFASIELNSEISENAVEIAFGVCQDGDPGHSCEGNVSIMLENGSYFLFFEDYDATDGPDVWFYMTKEANEGDTTAVEEEGLKVLVTQTMEKSDGKAEVEGTFSVPLPDDFNPVEWEGLSVWCDAYNILMGSVGFTIN